MWWVTECEFLCVWFGLNGILALTFVLDYSLFMNLQLLLLSFLVRGFCFSWVLVFLDACFVGIWGITMLFVSFVWLVLLYLEFWLIWSVLVFFCLICVCLCFVLIGGCFTWCFCLILIEVVLFWFGVIDNWFAWRVFNW